MAAQSITFDFLSRGAASLSRDFRSIGDDSALSSRGVKVLSDVIERLGAKEDRTAAESKLLAGALRQTGDAADRATAKAVLADAAIRRLGDAEQEASKKSDSLSRALGGLKLNPGLAGPAVALLPALATLTGVVAGAGIGLAGAFVAGGGALAAFGAVAKPVLTDAKTAATAVEKAQNNYAIAIANGTKQSVAYKAEQIAIAKAYANLSPAQIALSQQLGVMAKSWDAVKTAQTPLVAGALQPWLKSVTDLTRNLAPIIAAVSPVIKALGVQFDALVNSAAFRGFRDFIAGTGSRVVGAAGGTIIDLVKSFLILLPKFNPLILQMTGGIAAIGPAVLKWASSAKTADQITAFMGWFKTNGPVVGGLLANIALALKALAPGLTSGGLTELKVISDFFGLVAKLPPGLAKPLTEVAASMLILNKLGVISVGIKLVGLGTAGAGAAGGPLAAAGGAIAAGIVFKIREDLKSGLTGVIRDIPHWFNFGSLGFIVQSAQGWADLIVSKIRHSLLSWEDDVRHRIADTFDGIRHDVSARWDAMWGAVRGAVSAGIAWLAGAWRTLQGGVVSAYNTVRAAIASAWSTIWTNTRNAVTTGISNVVSFFQGLPGKVVSALSSLGGMLRSAAATAVGDFLKGFTSGVGGVIRYVESFGKAILGALNKIFHFGSPSSVMYDMGANVVQGLLNGLHAKLPALDLKAKQIADAAKNALNVPGGGGPATAGAAQAQAYAKSRLGAYGWGQDQWPALQALWTGESGWNRLARNPGSGAYGIPQALPASKMGAAANPPTSSAAAQIDWGMNYIKNTIGYGSPSVTYAKWLARSPHWYGGGLDAMFTRPTLIGVGERGPEHVQVTPGGGGDLGGKLDRLSAQVAELIRTTAAVPAATGRHVAAGVNGAGADAAFRRRYPGR